MDREKIKCLGFFPRATIDLISRKNSIMYTKKNKQLGKFLTSVVCGSTKKEGRLDWTEDKGGGKRF
jgi:hypothetical protein